MTVDDIASLLVTDGFGVLGTTLFKHLLPDQPDACVVVNEYAGGPGEDVFGEASPALEQPRVQIRVRGTAFDYDTPRLLIEQIYQSLSARGSVVVGRARYLHFGAIQPPFPLDRDAANRYVLAVNFALWKERTLVASFHEASDPAAVHGGDGSEVA